MKPHTSSTLDVGTALSQSPGGRGQWLTIATLAALAIAIAAGWLARELNADPLQTLLIGAGTFSGAVMLSLTMIKFLIE